MAYPNSAAVTKTPIHSGSVRPYDSSPLAAKPGNIAQGSNSTVTRVGPRGSNQPRILGGKR